MADIYHVLRQPVDLFEQTESWPEPTVTLRDEMLAFVDQIPCLKSHQFLLLSNASPTEMSARLRGIKESIVQTYAKHIATLRDHHDRIPTDPHTCEILNVLGTLLYQAWVFPQWHREEGVVRLVDGKGSDVPLEGANRELNEWCDKSCNLANRLEKMMVDDEGLVITSRISAAAYVSLQIQSSQRLVACLDQDILRHAIAPNQLQRSKAREMVFQKFAQPRSVTFSVEEVPRLPSREAFQSFETQLQILQQMREQKAHEDDGEDLSISEACDTSDESSSAEDTEDYELGYQYTTFPVASSERCPRSQVERDWKSQHHNRSDQALESDQIARHMNVFSARAGIDQGIPQDAMNELEERIPIRGIRGGYMSPHNSDSEREDGQGQDHEDEESDENSSSSEEEYEGDDLDATDTTQAATNANPNNPLISEEPLVFQQRSKYFQTHQERREVESKSRRASISGGMALFETNETIGTGGLFGSGALFESEKAAASTDSLGSTKRKRNDDDDESGDGKGKQTEEEDKEAPLHDDIDNYERELRELEERNRKRMMMVKGD